MILNVRLWGDFTVWLDFPLAYHFGVTPKHPAFYQRRTNNEGEKKDGNNSTTTARG